MRAGPRVHRDSAPHLMALDLVKWDRETHSMTLVKSHHIVTPLPRTLPLCSVGLPKCSLHPNPGFRAPGWSQIWLIPPNPAGLKPQGGPTLHLLAAALPPPPPSSPSWPLSLPTLPRYISPPSPMMLTATFQSECHY